MENIIEVKNLTKKFKHFVAVDNVSFAVKKKEIFGFLGPNGAGKSTTIRVLTTLLRPSFGTATVAGFDIEKREDEVRKHIGLVAEKIILYDHLTARENLEFFGQLYGFNKVKVREKANKWIPKLHMTEWLNTQVGALSTGMKQRINIVRALLTEPDILFLDEPTLGLDPQTTRLIREFIRDLNDHGVTVLLTTHDMIEAEILSDRVAIMDHGKIAACDTVFNLLQKIPGKTKPTLEDVFLKITGEKIRDSASGRVSLTPGHHFGGGNVKRVR
jgi:ABC-2 type transport system ATP-binding protein